MKKYISFSIKGNKDLTDSFLFFRSLLLYDAWKTSKQADGGSDLWTIYRCSGRKNWEWDRSKNKGSMGSTPSFDSSCGRAVKLPNLCASYLSLPTAPAPPPSTSCLLKLYNCSRLKGNLSTHSNQPNPNKIQSQYNVMFASPNETPTIKKNQRHSWHLWVLINLWSVTPTTARTYCLDCAFKTKRKISREIERS